MCHDNTRVAVLGNVIAWAQGGNGLPICWLHGPAGSGESTIAHTLARRYDEQKMLAFSFFFSRRNIDRNDATKLFLTFAYQLARALPSVKQAMQDALFEDPLILHHSLEDQLTKLIINPLRSAGDRIPRMVIVIDGLDECCNEAHVNEIVPRLVAVPISAALCKST